METALFTGDHHSISRCNLHQPLPR
jgi:hypothetical protein